MRISVDALLDFFEAHGDVAFPFYHNLLRVVADKVRRDTRRMSEMRGNLIRTQKAMKKLRDLVLETEDTAISKPVFDTLDELIEHNRRWHYMVEPGQTLFASVRLDNGSLAPVLELSLDHVKVPVPEPKPAPNTAWSGVLILPNGEIPISGTVLAVEPDRLVVQLDLLIANYHAVLEEYLTRVHMLDFLV